MGEAPASRRMRNEERRPRRAVWIIAASAVLAAALLCGWIFWPEDAGVVPTAAAAYEPDYAVQYDGAELDEAYLGQIRSFAAKAGKELLNGQESIAYSPTTLYTALSMVTELADGSSLQSLLGVLEAGGTEELQRYSSGLWRYLCANPDMKAPGKVMMANSLWLNRDYTFNGKTLQNLAGRYYVSSYTGDMMSEIPDMVSSWVKKQTNGLLDCQVQPNENTIAVLLSAIYFYDEWAEAFEERSTVSGRFNAGEKWIDCNYMCRAEESCGYYQGGGVTAAAQYFKNGGKMLFILPDEGNSPAGVLSSSEFLTSLLAWENLEKETGTADWMIPRFTLKNTLNLQDGLTALGLGELFDSCGNPLPKLSSEPAFIGRAEQGAAVSIDEKGCEAASYVEIEMQTKGALPKQDVFMYLDRPFIFAILSDNDVPLFLGVVHSPKG